MDALKIFLKVLYDGRNITEDISRHLLELSFTDNLTGVADDLEIKLEDVELKWQNEWYPTKGSLLTIEIGLLGGTVLKVNPFQIDELSADWSVDAGDVVSIKALGAGITKKLRTKRSHAHENKTLREIVNTTAARHGLTVIGNIDDINIGRITQHQEKDIAFLYRLADEYGYAFNIKGDKLIFTHRANLELSKAVLTIDKTGMISGSLSDKGFSTYKDATVKSHNPTTNKVVSYNSQVAQVPNGDGLNFSFLQKLDSLELRGRTENAGQAKAKADAGLHKANTLQQTGRFAVIGDVLLVAGNNVELTGIGRNSGIWHILKANHKFDRETGWRTEFEAKRVVAGSISGSNAKPKQNKVKSTNYKVVSEANKDSLNFSYLQK